MFKRERDSFRLASMKKNNTLISLVGVMKPIPCDSDFVYFSATTFILYAQPHIFTIFRFYRKGISWVGGNGIAYSLSERENERTNRTKINKCCILHGTHDLTCTNASSLTLTEWARAQHQCVWTHKMSDRGNTNKMLIWWFRNVCFMRNASGKNRVFFIFSSNLILSLVSRRLMLLKSAGKLIFYRTHSKHTASHAQLSFSIWIKCRSFKISQSFTI